MKVFLGSPGCTQKLWKICCNQFPCLFSLCYQTVDLVSITLTKHNSKMEMTHAWPETLYRIHSVHVHPAYAYMFAEYSPHVSMWLGHLLCPFTIKCLWKVYHFRTHLPCPSLQCSPYPLVSWKQQQDTRHTQGNLVNRELRVRVTGAGLWQPCQGELFIYSNVSNRSRTEIESAAAPRNPLSLELPTVARHKPSGSSGKQQLIPRHSADQPKIGSHKST